MAQIENSKTFMIRHASLVTPGARIPDAAVRIRNGRISAVAPSSELPIRPGESVLHAAGLTLVPGFIDLQCNGGFGHDFTRDPKTIWAVAAALPEFGVTSFLPTIITSPLDIVSQAQSVVTNRPPTWKGSEPLGLHLEGPYLNPLKKGAHNPAHIRRPNKAEVEDWLPESGVRLVTLAVELEGAQATVRYLADAGVTVSVGHSMATIEETKRGFDWGVTYGTHLFNAMPPLHHRRPGVAGALLADERVIIGIIPDGVHVHPGLVKSVWRAANPRLNIVTDAMAAMGMPHGRYELGGFEATVDESGCRLSDGTLAGSTVTLDAALRNLIAYAGITLAEALPAVTTIPARLLGIGERKGQVVAGYDADLVLLSEEMRVQTTIVAGQIIYP